MYDPNSVGEILIIHREGSFPDFIDLTHPEFNRAEEIYPGFPNLNPGKIIPTPCKIIIRDLIIQGVPAIVVEKILDK